MLFRKSPYVYSPGVGGARVLALYSGNSIGEIRIKPFLNALLGRGIIAEYRIADRALKSEGLHGPYAFTHIWCQRNLSTAQFAFLKAHTRVPVIYDIDDLLTSIPPFVASTRRTMRKRVEWCLHHAKQITAASELLRRSLGEDAPTAAGKIIVLKNGFGSSSPPEPRGARKRLVWTSSDLPFFLRENPSFAPELAALLNRHGYEAVLIGRFDHGVRALFSRSRHIGHLDFVSFREYLRTLAGSLAIAPMPTRLPGPAQRYFDAKSDIKLVDYLSCGLVPIVSDAASYSRSELFMPEFAAATAQDLLQKIEICIADPDAALSKVDATIHRAGLLNEREFSALSKPLDPLFAQRSTPC